MPLNDLIRIRKGSSSEWSGINPILDSGEPGFDVSNNFLKIGYSGNNWNTIDPIGSHLPKLKLDGILYDSNNNSGINNQILSSTSSGTLWTNYINAYVVSGVDYIRFDTTPESTGPEGSVYWDDGEGSLLINLKGGNVITPINQTLTTLVYNAESTILNKGEVVYASGAQGQRVAVRRASNLSDLTSSRTFGLVAEPIAAGNEGWIINRGELAGLNTNSYNEGDILWLGSGGGTLTTTKPTAPQHLVFVGIVVKKNISTGRVYVAVQNGYELEELHDVAIYNAVSGQFLKYDGSLWKNSGILSNDITNFNSSVSGLLTPYALLASGNFNYLAVNGIPVSTGTSGGTNITNPGTNRVLLSDGTANGIIAQSGLTFNGSSLFINGVNSRNGQNLYMWSNFR
jgi:hypothetical protein